MMVRVEMEHFNTGKRVRKGFTRDYEIRDDLWELLCELAENNQFCSRGTYEWNQNVLYLVRIKSLDKLMEDNSQTVEEINLMREIRKEHFNGFVHIEKIFVVNSFEKRAIKVKGNQAFFRSNAGGVFGVSLSDKVQGKIRENDLCKINVLATGKWLVVDKVEEEQCDLDIFKSLGGGY